MNHFPAFASGLQLIERLVSEESVFCLPGECFDYPDFMRLVLTVPKDLMQEACDRISDFFSRYYTLTDGRSRSRSPFAAIESNHNANNHKITNGSRIEREQSMSPCYSSDTSA